MHVYIYTYICTRARARTHTHTHTHVCIEKSTSNSRTREVRKPRPRAATARTASSDASSKRISELIDEGSSRIRVSSILRTRNPAAARRRCTLSSTVIGAPGGAVRGFRLRSALRRCSWLRYAKVSERPSIEGKETWYRIKKTYYYQRT
jgi:hypothetical protein